MKKRSAIIRVLVLMLAIALFASCSSMKKTTAPKAAGGEVVSVVASETPVSDYSGHYQWFVTGTPNGDQEGSMFLKNTETGYIGELAVMGTSVPIDKIIVKGSTMIGYIAIQDMELSFSIKFEGDGFKGNIYAMEEGFPFSGNKTK